jgi:hypothetical protein
VKKLTSLFVLLLVFISLSSFDTISSKKTAAGPLPTTTEMVTGLKQALEQGTTKSADQLSVVDGFFKNAAIKILLPPDAQKAEKTLRRLGMNKLCDDAIHSLNRAAEDAAKQAKPIFISAIKQMTIQDATNILLGGNDAATQYFKRTTTAQLSLQFKPVIHTSLDNVGATRYYGALVSQYNRIPLVRKLNPDLDEYVTQKAIDGLFYQIALEELNIRQSLSARTTPVLQKVFGFVDQKLGK